MAESSGDGEDFLYLDNEDKMVFTPEKPKERSAAKEISLKSSSSHSRHLFQGKVGSNAGESDPSQMKPDESSLEDGEVFSGSPSHANDNHPKRPKERWRCQTLGSLTSDDEVFSECKPKISISRTNKRCQTPDSSRSINTRSSKGSKFRSPSSGSDYNGSSRSRCYSRDSQISDENRFIKRSNLKHISSRRRHSLDHKKQPSEEVILSKVNERSSDIRRSSQDRKHKHSSRERHRSSRTIHHSTSRRSRSKSRRKSSRHSRSRSNDRNNSSRQRYRSKYSRSSSNGHNHSSRKRYKRGSRCSRSSSSSSEERRHCSNARYYSKRKRHRSSRDRRYWPSSSGERSNPPSKYKHRSRCSSSGSSTSRERRRSTDKNHYGPKSKDRRLSRERHCRKSPKRYSSDDEQLSKSTSRRNKDRACSTKYRRHFSSRGSRGSSKERRSSEERHRSPRSSRRGTLGSSRDRYSSGSSRDRHSSEEKHRSQRKHRSLHRDKSFSPDQSSSRSKNLEDKARSTENRRRLSSKRNGRGSSKDRHSSGQRHRSPRKRRSSYKDKYCSPNHKQSSKSASRQNEEDRTHLTENRGHLSSKGTEGSSKDRHSSRERYPLPRNSRSSYRDKSPDKNESSSTSRNITSQEERAHSTEKKRQLSSKESRGSSKDRHSPGERHRSPGKRRSSYRDKYYSPDNKEPSLKSIDKKHLQEGTRSPEKRQHLSSRSSQGSSKDRHSPRKRDKSCSPDNNQSSLKSRNRKTQRSLSTEEKQHDSSKECSVLSRDRPQSGEKNTLTRKHQCLSRDKSSSPDDKIFLSKYKNSKERRLNELKEISKSKCSLENKNVSSKDHGISNDASTLKTIEKSSKERMSSDNKSDDQVLSNNKDHKERKPKNRESLKKSSKSAVKYWPLEDDPYYSNVNACDQIKGSGLKSKEKIEIFGKVPSFEKSEKKSLEHETSLNVRKESGKFESSLDGQFFLSKEKRLSNVFCKSSKNDKSSTFEETGISRPLTHMSTNSEIVDSAGKSGHLSPVSTEKNPSSVLHRINAPPSDNYNDKDQSRPPEVSKSVELAQISSNNMLDELKNPSTVAHSLGNEFLKRFVIPKKRRSEQSSTVVAKRPKIFSSTEPKLPNLPNNKVKSSKSIDGSRTSSEGDVPVVKNNKGLPLNTSKEIVHVGNVRKIPPEWVMQEINRCKALLHERAAVRQQKIVPIEYNASEKCMSKKVGNEPSKNMSEVEIKKVCDSKTSQYKSRFGLNKESSSSNKEISKNDLSKKLSASSRRYSSSNPHPEVKLKQTSTCPQSLLVKSTLGATSCKSCDTNRTTSNEKVIETESRSCIKDDNDAKKKRKPSIVTSETESIIEYQISSPVRENELSSKGVGKRTDTFSKPNLSSEMDKNLSEFSINRNKNFVSKPHDTKSSESHVTLVDAMTVSNKLVSGASCLNISNFYKNDVEGFQKDYNQPNCSSSALVKTKQRNSVKDSCDATVENSHQSMDETCKSTRDKFRKKCFSFDELVGIASQQAVKVISKSESAKELLLESTFITQNPAELNKDKIALSKDNRDKTCKKNKCNGSESARNVDQCSSLLLSQTDNSMAIIPEGSCQSKASSIAVSSMNTEVVKKNPPGWVLREINKSKALISEQASRKSVTSSNNKLKDVVVSTNLSTQCSHDSKTISTESNSKNITLSGSVESVINKQSCPRSSLSKDASSSESKPSSVSDDFSHLKILKESEPDHFLGESPHGVDYTSASSPKINDESCADKSIERRKKGARLLEVIDSIVKDSTKCNEEKILSSYSCEEKATDNSDKVIMNKNDNDFGYTQCSEGIYSSQLELENEKNLSRLESVANDKFAKNSFLLKKATDKNDKMIMNKKDVEFGHTKSSSSHLELENEKKNLSSLEIIAHDNSDKMIMNKKDSGLDHTKCFEDISSSKLELEKEQQNLSTLEKELAKNSFLLKMTTTKAKTVPRKPIVSNIYSVFSTPLSKNRQQLSYYDGRTPSPANRGLANGEDFANVLGLIPAENNRPNSTKGRLLHNRMMKGASGRRFNERLHKGKSSKLKRSGRISAISSMAISHIKARKDCDLDENETYISKDFSNKDTDNINVISVMQRQCRMNINQPQVKNMGKTKQKWSKQFFALEKSNDIMNFSGLNEISSESEFSNQCESSCSKHLLSGIISDTDESDCESVRTQKCSIANLRKKRAKLSLSKSYQRAVRVARLLDTSSEEDDNKINKNSKVKDIIKLTNVTNTVRPKASRSFSSKNTYNLRCRYNTNQVHQGVAPPSKEVSTNSDSKYPGLEDILSNIDMLLSPEVRTIGEFTDKVLKSTKSNNAKTKASCEPGRERKRNVCSISFKKVKAKDSCPEQSISEAVQAKSEYKEKGTLSDQDPELRLIEDALAVSALILAEGRDLGAARRFSQSPEYLQKKSNSDEGREQVSDKGDLYNDIRSCSTPCLYNSCHELLHQVKSPLPISSARTPDLMTSISKHSLTSKTPELMTSLLGQSMKTPELMTSLASVGKSVSKESFDSSLDFKLNISSGDEINIRDIDITDTFQSMNVSANTSAHGSSTDLQNTELTTNKDVVTNNIPHDERASLKDKAKCFVISQKTDSIQTTVNCENGSFHEDEDNESKKELNSLSSNVVVFCTKTHRRISSKLLKLLKMVDKERPGNILPDVSSAVPSSAQNPSDEFAPIDKSDNSSSEAGLRKDQDIERDQCAKLPIESKRIKTSTEYNESKPNLVQEKMTCKETSPDDKEDNVNLFIDALAAAENEIGKYVIDDQNLNEVESIEEDKGINSPISFESSTPSSCPDRTPSVKRSIYDEVDISIARSGRKSTRDPGSSPNVFPRELNYGAPMNDKNPPRFYRKRGERKPREKVRSYRYIKRSGKRSIESRSTSSEADFEVNSTIKSRDIICNHGSKDNTEQAKEVTKEEIVNKEAKDCDSFQDESRKSPIRSKTRLLVEKRGLRRLQPPNEERKHYEKLKELESKKKDLEKEELSSDGEEPNAHSEQQEESEEENGSVIHHQMSDDHGQIDSDIAFGRQETESEVANSKCNSQPFSQEVKCDQTQLPLLTSVVQLEPIVQQKYPEILQLGHQPEPCQLNLEWNDIEPCRPINNENIPPSDSRQPSQASSNQFGNDIENVDDQNILQDITKFHEAECKAKRSEYVNTFLYKPIDWSDNDLIMKRREKLCELIELANANQILREGVHITLTPSAQATTINYNTSNGLGNQSSTMNYSQTEHYQMECQYNQQYYNEGPQFSEHRDSFQNKTRPQNNLHGYQDESDVISQAQNLTNVNYNTDNALVKSYEQSSSYRSNIINVQKSKVIPEIFENNENRQNADVPGLDKLKNSQIIDSPDVGGDKNIVDDVKRSSPFGANDNDTRIMYSTAGDSKKATFTDDYAAGLGISSSDYNNVDYEPGLTKDYNPAGIDLSEQEKLDKNDNDACQNDKTITELADIAPSSSQETIPYDVENNDLVRDSADVLETDEKLNKEAQTSFTDKGISANLNEEIDTDAPDVVPSSSQETIPYYVKNDDLVKEGFIELGNENKMNKEALATASTKKLKTVLNISCDTNLVKALVNKLVDDPSEEAKYDTDTTCEMFKNSVILAQSVQYFIDCGDSKKEHRISGNLSALLHYAKCVAHQRRERIAKEGLNANRISSMNKNCDAKNEQDFDQTESIVKGTDIDYNANQKKCSYGLKTLISMFKEEKKNRDIQEPTNVETCYSSDDAESHCTDDSPCKSGIKTPAKDVFTFKTPIKDIIRYKTPSKDPVKTPNKEKCLDTPYKGHAHEEEFVNKDISDFTMSSLFNVPHESNLGLSKLNPEITLSALFADINASASQSLTSFSEAIRSSIGHDLPELTMNSLFNNLTHLSSKERGQLSISEAIRTAIGSESKDSGSMLQDALTSGGTASESASKNENEASVTIDNSIQRQESSVTCSTEVLISNSSEHCVGSEFLKGGIHNEEVVSSSEAAKQERGSQIPHTAAQSPNTVCPMNDDEQSNGCGSKSIKFIDLPDITMSSLMCNLNQMCETLNTDNPFSLATLEQDGITFKTESNKQMFVNNYKKYMNDLATRLHKSRLSDVKKRKRKVVFDLHGIPVSPGNAKKNNVHFIKHSPKTNRKRIMSSEVPESLKSEATKSKLGRKRDSRKMTFENDIPFEQMAVLNSDSQNHGWINYGDQIIGPIPIIDVADIPVVQSEFLVPQEAPKRRRKRKSEASAVPTSCEIVNSDFKFLDNLPLVENADNLQASTIDLDFINQEFEIGKDTSKSVNCEKVTLKRKRNKKGKIQRRAKKPRC